MSRFRSLLTASASLGALALAGSVLAGSVLAGSVLGGCASNKLDAKAEELRSNPSPELDSPYQRDADLKNAQTITNDENLRALRSDWERFWLLERPSRLTPEPVPK